MSYCTVYSIFVCAYTHAHPYGDTWTFCYSVGCNIRVALCSESRVQFAWLVQTHTLTLTHTWLPARHCVLILPGTCKSASLKKDCSLIPSVQHDPRWPSHTSTHSHSLSDLHSQSLSIQLPHLFLLHKDLWFSSFLPTQYSKTLHNGQDISSGISSLNIKTLLDFKLYNYYYYIFY